VLFAFKNFTQIVRLKKAQNEWDGRVWNYSWSVDAFVPNTPADSDRRRSISAAEEEANA
jgi:hypothetical protein